MVHSTKAIGKSFGVKNEKRIFSNLKKGILPENFPPRTMMTDFFIICG